MGRTKKLAEQDAARRALEQLESAGANAGGAPPPNAENDTGIDTEIEETSAS
jgi:hypothetical protein